MPRQPTAYSYVRFSTKAQADGDSLRRQTRATAAWCEKNKIPLDDSLTFHDLGKSAYLGEHRKNPDRHRLAAFLKMVETGRIPRGSYLVVESLDRLTREHIQAALLLILHMLQDGVRVVQLSPVEVVYDDKSEAHTIMLMIVELMRGHGESKRKSELITPAWAEKKRAAREGRRQPDKKENRTNGMRLLTHMTPAWVEERGGEPVLIPERAAAVKRVFELSAEGFGEMLICRRLEAEGFRPFGPSGRWVKAYVRKILVDRRVVGEYQPRHRVVEDGRRVLRPDGDPIPGHFPAVVTEEQWQACRGFAAERRLRRGRLSADRHVNLFQGLLKDARSGGSYFSTTRFKGGRCTHRILINTDGTEGRVARATFPQEVFERAVLSCLREIDPHEILNGDHPDESLALSAQLAGVEAEHAAAVAYMDLKGFSPAIGDRITKLEARRRDVAALLAEARRKAAHPLSESWGEAQSLIDALDAAPDPEEARLRLRSAVRRMVDEVWLLVVARGSTRLCAVQVWFTGGKRHRDYLIARQGAKGNGKKRTEGGWSLPPAMAGNIDLRSTKDAAKLDKLLAEIDVEDLTQTMLE